MYYSSGHLHSCVVGFIGGSLCSVWWCSWILVAICDVVASGVVVMVSWLFVCS